MVSHQNNLSGSVPQNAHDTLSCPSRLPRARARERAFGFGSALLELVLASPVLREFHFFFELSSIYPFWKSRAFMGSHGEDALSWA